MTVIKITLTDEDIVKLNRVRREMVQAASEPEWVDSKIQITTETLVRGLMRVGMERAVEDKGEELLLPEIR